MHLTNTTQFHCRNTILASGQATSLKESNTTMPRRLPLVPSKWQQRPLPNVPISVTGAPGHVPYTRSRIYCTRRGQFRPTEAERSMTRRTSTMHSGRGNKLQLNIMAARGPKLLVWQQQTVAHCCLGNVVQLYVKAKMPKLWLSGFQV